MDIVITCYFTGKNDPLRKNNRENNSDDILKPWVDSLKKNELNGLIFHDNLSEEFMAKYRSEYLDFVHHKLHTGWSINDERFLAYYEFLKENEQYKRILLTDLFDVLFYKNPFKVISKPEILYVGNNGDKLINRNSFVSKKMKHAYGKVLYGKEKSINAGVIGGYRNTIMTLLEKMIDDFYTVNGNKNLNMAIFNKVAYETFGKNKMVVGNPFTSKLRRNETKGNFAVKHK